LKEKPNDWSRIYHDGAKTSQNPSLTLCLGLSGNFGSFRTMNYLSIVAFQTPNTSSLDLFLFNRYETYSFPNN